MPLGKLPGAQKSKSEQGKALVFATPSSAGKKPEGREHLRRLLDWEKFDEVRDSRRSILLDTLYESIIFAVGKGFPWVEVVEVVKFTDELLKETKGATTISRKYPSDLSRLILTPLSGSEALSYGS
ncbi:Hypothetical protein D623_10010242 [Myotis brandtii]|uniref:Uncharacterized protein n=1 Tax=Myotis brandtii TaxID=109478 RepID=S7P0Y2_MYOBR|nr:Hypothetical protein D623_10010242 [Myotis brandtii]